MRADTGHTRAAGGNAIACVGPTARSRNWCPTRNTAHHPAHLHASSSHLACSAGSCCCSTPSSRPASACQAQDLGAVQCGGVSAEVARAPGDPETTRELLATSCAWHLGGWANMQAAPAAGGCTRAPPKQHCHAPAPSWPTHLQMCSGGGCAAVQLAPLLRLLLQTGVKAVHGCRAARGCGHPQAVRSCRCTVQAICSSCVAQAVCRANASMLRRSCRGSSAPPPKADPPC